MRMSSPVVAVLVLLCLAGPARAQEAPATFTPTACPPGFAATACGLVTVPARHDTPAGPTLKIAVAVYAAHSPNPQPDPLVVLVGDAGQSTLARLDPALALGQLDALRSTRDVVLIDQRGTQYSEPFLNCPSMDEWVLQRLRRGLGPVAVQEGVATAARQCAAGLRANGIDLGAFNSLQTARDVPVVLDALGYSGPVNLYAAGYGTRLAMHLLHEHPARLRSVVLDAPLPPTANLAVEAPANGLRALETLFADCAADVVCRAAFPDLNGQFLAVAERLNAGPPTVNVLAGEQTVVVSLTGSVFTELVLHNLAVTPRLPQLPQLMVAASNADFRLVTLAVPDLVLNNGAAGVAFGAGCAAGTFTEPVAAEAAAYYAGYQTALPLVCPDWPAEPLPAEALTLPNATVPTLVLNGRYDPISPPHYADAVAAALPNSTRLSIPTAGHGILPGPDCPQEIMAAFISDPNTAPDSACLAALRLMVATDALRSETLAGGDVIGESARFQVPLGWVQVEPGFYAAPDGARALLFFDFGGSDPLVAVQNTAGLALAETPLAVLQLAQRWDVYDTALQGQRVALVALTTPEAGRSYAMVYILPAERLAVEGIAAELQPILATFALRRLPPTPTPTPTITPFPAG